MNDHEVTLRRYAELMIRFGVNLQPGQSLRIGAELEHAPLVRLAAEVAYEAGAMYVQVDWSDTPLQRARFVHSAAEHLAYFPAYEVTRHEQMVEEGWARLALVGQSHPELLKDVDPAKMRTVAVTRAQRLKFYTQAMMANKMQWCVAGVPTRAWAAQVYPELAPDEALARLWATVLHTCRLDAPDPLAAWQVHDAALKSVANYLMAHKVCSLHFMDEATGPDGKPLTDLTIGLTERPNWVTASAQRPDGVPFMPNMPTEEVFTTPDNRRADGYARLSRPAFPFQREVRNAVVHFAGGEVVGFDAEEGREVLEQFFALDGTRRLGEVALVETDSPVGQVGVVFYDILFDENAACHIAFGEAYPEGVVGGSAMSADELRELGVNKSDAHLDVMIGTPTLRLTGITADGRELPIMDRGKFVATVVGG
jgi:aminopeptidase